MTQASDLGGIANPLAAFYRARVNVNLQALGSLVRGQRDCRARPQQPAGDETNWDGWADIPDALWQSIGVQLAMFGSNGNGSTTATILSIGVDVKTVDQTSAARLLPRQVLPAEKLAADGTALRSYSVQDIADIGFAATPAPTVRTGISYTLALGDNHSLVECANAAAITVGDQHPLARWP
ncbi:MAG: hypothetical protein IPK66_05135 [Rhodospirillales bacterium]|nr:hypothetical protein [Rhodospirillales bacterium]